MASNIGIVRSITQVGTYEPFELQVARGQIAGHSTVNIYGAQGALSTTYLPLWENLSAYTYPGSAATMHVASSVNTGSDKTGTTVLVQGLDSSYVAISETVTLNGTTAVTTTKSYLRINSMSVSAGAPTGTITLKDLTDTTTYAQINPTIGRTQMSLYTVPAGFTFYLSRIDAYTSLNGATADYNIYRNVATTSAGVTSVSQQAPFTNTYHAQRVMPRAFSEKTDIQLQCKAATGPSYTSIAAEGFLVANYIVGTTG
jgi:hypothetical protein